ncbi:S8 family peptidase [Patulibacter americanus]|uniref:S8 family peptidase n=1 Tax=Patulibacter americanus TaxID=588672 RepID=UPI0003B53FF9|nr:S8 family serine peptidase [Patulibacter americanus]
MNRPVLRHRPLSVLGVVVACATLAGTTLGAATPAGAATPPAAPTTSGPTGRLLVTVRGAHGNATHAVSDRVEDSVRQAGSRAVAADATGTTAAVRAGDAASRARLKARLERDPDVVEVVEEHRAAVRALPNDAVLHDQDPAAPPGVEFGWWAKGMKLPQAWSLANGKGTTVAVIDSGFDLTHPQLSGIVDRALVIESQGVPGTARTDEYGHGTHVASLACSAFNDGAGTVGAGGRCRLITIKSDLYDTSVAKAVKKATALGADAIVMSFGVDGDVPAPEFLKQALQDAADKGVVLVAAAADKATTQQGYPANVLQPTGTGADLEAGIGLSVTAALATGVRASFAGSGSQISVAGYGAFADVSGPPGILGAFPAAVTANEQPSKDGPAVAKRVPLRGDTRYAYQAGTSMATPMVAGVAALVRTANPGLTAAGIVRVIKDTASRPEGWTTGTGWGVVNGYAAVDTARRIDLRAPRATFRSRSRTISGSRTTLSWTVTDKAPKPLVASGVRRVEVWRSVDGRRFARVAATGATRLAVSVPRGTVRYALRGVDRAGNRAGITKRATVTITR